MAIKHMKVDKKSKIFLERIVSGGKICECQGSKDTGGASFSFGHYLSGAQNCHLAYTPPANTDQLQKLIWGTDDAKKVQMILNIYLID
jgi:hypothetical protein